MRSMQKALWLALLLSFVSFDANAKVPKHAVPKRWLITKHKQSGKYLVRPIANTKNVDLRIHKNTKRKNGLKQADRIFVATASYGEMYDAVRMLVDPSFVTIRQKESGRYSRKQFHASSAIRYQLEEMLDRGYTVVTDSSPTTNTFLHAVSSPRTAAILHEGHSMYHLGTGIVRMQFRQDNGNLDTVELEKSLVPKGFKASPNLRFIASDACKLQRSEDIYRKLLKLGPNVEWIAGIDNQNATTILKRYDFSNSPVARAVDRMPRVKSFSKKDR